MFKRAAFAVSLLACNFSFAADEPQWLKDARARESKSLKPAQIQSKDGWFKVSTPGKSVGTIELEQGSYSVELDIGGDSNVHCEVYPKGVDLANTLRVTFDNAMKNAAERQGKLEARALESSEAGAHGAVPYIAMNWVYRVAGSNGSLLGGFKQIVLEKDNLGVYCAHNAFGFTRTFAAIGKAFADSLQTQEAVNAPQYMEISAVTMSGKKIGVAVTTVQRDSEGDTRAKQMSAMLVSMPNDIIHAQDATHIEWVRPDGTLINAGSTEVVNGELSTDLTLQQDEDAWVVEGKAEGTPVKAALPEGALPGNSLLQARELRALLAEPDAVGREHTMNLWLDENPVALTPAKIKVLSRQGIDRFATLAEVGEIKANLTLDKATGMPSAAEMKIGPIAMQLERVYVNGSL
jgi:hypothetical protein